MSRSTPQQYGRVYAALKMLKKGEDFKEDMVYSYTQDKAKVSLKDLDFDQCHDLIMKLNQMVSPSSAASPSPSERAGVRIEDKDTNTIRRKVLAIAHQLGWYVKDGDGNIILFFDKKKLDYPRIDAWCIKHTSAHKKLNAMNKEELQKAAYQFDRMYKNYLTPKAK